LINDFRARFFWELDDKALQRYEYANQVISINYKFLGVILNLKSQPAVETLIIKIESSILIQRLGL